MYFIWKSFRERKGDRSSIYWFKWTQQLELDWSTAGSQVLLSSCPGRCRGPRPWTLLHCFPRRSAGSWMRNAACGATHMGCCRQKELAYCTSALPHNLVCSDFIPIQQRIRSLKSIFSRCCYPYLGFKHFWGTLISFDFVRTGAK